MKRLRTIAWLGVGMVVLGLPLSFYSSVLMTREELGSNNGYWIAYMLAIFGVVLLVIGGIITRPRFLWLAAIVAGIAYIVSLYGWLGNNDAGITGVIMVTLPGLVYIILGLLIRRFSRKRKKTKNL